MVEIEIINREREDLSGLLAAVSVDPHVPFLSGGLRVPATEAPAREEPRAY